MSAARIAATLASLEARVEALETCQLGWQEWSWGASPRPASGPLSAEQPEPALTSTPTPGDACDCVLCRKADR